MALSARLRFWRAASVGNDWSSIVNSGSLGTWSRDQNRTTPCAALVNVLDAAFRIPAAVLPPNHVRKRDPYYTMSGEEKENVIENGSIAKSGDSDKKKSATRKTSQKKIEANRRNALRSTGPRTSQGKKVVSRNATKHGVLSSEVFCAEEEEAEEFRRLLEKIYEEYEPQGPIEELLVERIATCWWRLKRAVRAESGELARERTVAQESFLSRHTRHIDQHWFDSTQWKTKIPESRAALATVRNEVEKVGSVAAGHRSLLVNLFGDDCSVLHVLESGHCPQETLKKRVLESINWELQKLEFWEEYLAQLDAKMASAKLLRSSIPSDSVADTLRRYETQIERQLYRAMDQLERIQRRRRGESVPAPLRLDIGK